MTQTLADLRTQIDALDAEILASFNRRARLAQQVAEAKLAAGDSDHFYRPEREAQVLQRVRELNPGPLDDDTVARLFRELMSACLALEKPLMVAYLGPEGTFSQQAAFKHFGHAIKGSPRASIDEIFRAVDDGACQFGVVPVENSTAGVIAQTLDCFLNASLDICGEVALRIHHNLLSKQTELSAIRCVFSHQQSLGQCRAWLELHLPHAEQIAVSSNAEAARLASQAPDSAAVAGEMTADLYGLNLLERHIEDDAENTTRFLVIGRLKVGPTGCDKTTLLISTGNQPGALHRALAPFAAHGISMSKIESRPSRRGAWDYVFFIDVEGHREDAQVAAALTTVQTQVSFLKVLGSYPRAQN
ncbi:MAG: prephenate dehydratase [Methylococcaceae bacterium]|nr:MAG: prephenate dehydratase [Methylococcaceae bacterium]